MSERCRHKGSFRSTMPHSVHAMRQSQSGVPCPNCLHPFRATTNEDKVVARDPCRYVPSVPELWTKENWLLKWWDESNIYLAILTQQKICRAFFCLVSSWSWKTIGSAHREQYIIVKKDKPTSGSGLRRKECASWTLRIVRAKKNKTIITKIFQSNFVFNCHCKSAFCQGEINFIFLSFSNIQISGKVEKNLRSLTLGLSCATSWRLRSESAAAEPAKRRATFSSLSPRTSRSQLIFQMFNDVWSEQIVLPCVPLAV